jgi:hypothetical protein
VKGKIMQYNPFVYARLEGVTNRIKFQKDILENWKLFSSVLFDLTVLDLSEIA